MHTFQPYPIDVLEMNNSSQHKNKSKDDKKK